MCTFPFPKRCVRLVDAMYMHAYIHAYMDTWRGTHLIGNYCDTVTNWYSMEVALDCDLLVRVMQQISLAGI